MSVVLIHSRSSSRRVNGDNLLDQRLLSRCFFPLAVMEMKGREMKGRERKGRRRVCAT